MISHVHQKQHERNSNNEKHGHDENQYCDLLASSANGFGFVQSLMRVIKRNYCAKTMLYISISDLIKLANNFISNSPVKFVLVIELVVDIASTSLSGLVFNAGKLFAEIFLIF